MLCLNVQVEVVALSSYEEKEEQFREQVITRFNSLDKSIHVK